MKWTYEYQDTADSGPSYVIRNETGEWIADAYHEDVARTIVDIADARAQGVRDVAKWLEEDSGKWIAARMLRALLPPDPIPGERCEACVVQQSMGVAGCMLHFPRKPAPPAPVEAVPVYVRDCPTCGSPCHFIGADDAQYDESVCNRVRGTWEIVNCTNLWRIRP